MNNFSCTIWQFIAFGINCLCCGISLGVTIGRYIWKREIYKLMFEESDNDDK